MLARAFNLCEDERIGLKAARHEGRSPELWLDDTTPKRWHTERRGSTSPQKERSKEIEKERKKERRKKGKR